LIETWPFLAVLASALLHASWNALARASSEPGDVVASAVIAAGLISVPALFWTGLPGQASWGWLLGGMVINVAGIRFSMAAYRRASFALTYPIMRAGIPMLALPVAFVLLGEWPRPGGAFGVVLIAAALLMLGFAARRSGRDELKGVGFALLAALAGAGYVSADAMGVRLGGNIFGYAFALAVGNAMLMALLTRVEGKSPVAMFRRHAGIAFGISFVSMTSFLLYIWAVAQTPVALAAALRETSVLFAVAIAAFVLKEEVGRWHWAAAFLALAGVAAIRAA
jgi:drug/metabolite transporter (DMT)-like permease